MEKTDFAALGQQLYDSDFGGMRTRDEKEKAKREQDEAIFRSGNPFPLTDLFPELLDEILSQDVLSTRDLVNCCLVSKAILPHAQRALYSSVRLDFIEDAWNKDVHFLPPAETSLFTTLVSSPALAEMVREASFRLETSDCSDITAQKYGVDIGDVDEEEYRLTEDFVEENKVDLPGMVRQVLQALPALQRVSLDLGGSEFDAVLELRLPTVIDLVATVLFPSLLSAFPSVQALEGAIPPLTDLSQTEAVGADAAPPLRSLKLYMRPAKYTGPSLTAFLRLIFGKSLGLQRLEIPFFPFFHFHLSQFGALRSLSIILKNGSSSTSSHEWFDPSFSCILSSLPTSLSHLEIQDSSPPPEEVVPFPQTYLASFPSTLLTLEFSARPFYPSNIFDFLAQIEHQLPHLAKLKFGDEPQDLFGRQIDDRLPWTLKDWDQVARICEEKGLREKKKEKKDGDCTIA
ncbi:hypothetical protein JCM8097_002996 [Rhodosporidiobolus ruineniae]